MPTDPATPPTPPHDVSAQVQRRSKIVNAITASTLPFIILAGGFRKSTALLVILTPALLLIVANVCYSVFVLCKCPSCKASLGFTRFPSHCPGCGARVRHTPEK